MFESLFGASIRTHVVQYGENLATIAECYYGDACNAMVIFQANRDRLTDPNRVYAGQRLVIPHIPHPRRSHNKSSYVV